MYIGSKCKSKCIRLSEKFLSFYEEIDAQRFSFYIISSNYVRSIFFCWDKHCDISQTWFHVCTKVHCRKKTRLRKEDTFRTTWYIRTRSRNTSIYVEFNIIRNTWDLDKKSLFIGYYKKWCIFAFVYMSMEIHIWKPWTWLKSCSVY